MQDKYSSYSSISLAGEDSFVRWALHGENEEDWKAWLLQYPHQQPIIEEAKKIVVSLTGVHNQELPEAGQKELWNRITTSIQAESRGPARNIRLPLWIWGLSAAAAVALLFWVNNLVSTDRVLAHAGEQKTIVLPEESTVTLNAESKLSFREKSFESERVLHLDGEAFFKVKPGSTFTVETALGKVTVLGTSFNVVSRAGRFEVTCYTGKVKVETAKQDQLIITPGESSIQNKEDKTLGRSTFTLQEETPGWIAGKFSFQNQLLSEVIRELERQYAVKVNLEPGLGELKYTGLFESGDLDTALYLITWPLHLNASVKGKTVSISR